MKHKFKVSNPSVKAKEFTEKDWLTQLILADGDFEFTALKKKVELNREPEKKIIPQEYVGTFINRINLLYQNKIRKFGSITYGAFCAFIYNHYALCQKHNPNTFLTYATILSYFKKERTGEPCRKIA